MLYQFVISINGHERNVSFRAESEAEAIERAREWAGPGAFIDGPVSCMTEEN